VQYWPVYQLYGRIIGIYRSGEREGKEDGSGEGGKSEGEKKRGKRGSVS